MSTLPALERGPGDRPVGALDGEDVLCGPRVRKGAGHGSGRDGATILRHAPKPVWRPRRRRRRNTKVSSSLRAIFDLEVLGEVREGVVAACEVANESCDPEAHSRLAVAPGENVRQSAAARRHECKIIDDVGL